MHSASSTGEELYQSDGTSDGTVLVEDQNPGKPDFDPEIFFLETEAS
jgi:ELWxxDGT repeat protein